MMRFKIIRIIFLKEFFDNLKDRRSLSMAIIFGPLIGPLIITISLHFSIKSYISDEEEQIELPVIGAEHAPNLIQHLKQNRIDIIEGPEDPQQSIQDNQYTAILEITSEYGQLLREGKPAVVRIYNDSSDQDNQKNISYINDTIRGYNSKIASLRLQLRGISHLTLNPIVIEDMDVSTPQSRSVVFLGMISYFAIFSMLMGGFYLAIDITAGERERKSLEPLMSLPIKRSEIAIGKFLTTLFFVFISFMLVLFIFKISLAYIQFEKLDMSLHYGPEVILQILLIGLPLAILSASFLTLIPAFAKSYKEAQTYLSIALFVPILPILFVGKNASELNLQNMLIPCLSQHLLIIGKLKDEVIQLSHIIISATTTLALSAIVLLVTIWLYRQERLLV